MKAATRTTLAKGFIFSLSTIACLLFCSCSSISVSRFAANRMIAIESDGSPYPFRIEADKNSSVEKAFNYREHLASISSSIKKSGRKKILIFVYGGMNPIDATIERTEELARIISESSDYYPIFINWESSLFDAYLDHLLFIRRGVYSYVIGPMLSPFVLVSDICRGITRLPINLFYQSYGLFYNDFGSQYLNQQIIREFESRHIRAYIGTNNSSEFMVFLTKILYIAGFPFRVITTPMIDVCGKSAWDVMQRRTYTAFVKAYPYEVSPEQEIQIALSPPGGACSLLMDELTKLTKGDDSYSFTLIGHSMGPLLVNELVKRYSNLPYKNIVYLAAACSIKDTLDAVVPYLRSHPESMFYNLCLHPNADIDSTMFCLGLPKGSILEWIDLYLSDPLARNDFVIGQWINAINNVPRMTRDVRSQIVIKAFGINDPETNTIQLDLPHNHTDFSNPVLRFWEKDFWQLPKQSIKANNH